MFRIEYICNCTLIPNKITRICQGLVQSLFYDTPHQRYCVMEKLVKTMVKLFTIRLHSTVKKHHCSTYITHMSCRSVLDVGNTPYILTNLSHFKMLRTTYSWLYLKVFNLSYRRVLYGHAGCGNWNISINLKSKYINSE